MGEWDVRIISASHFEDDDVTIELFGKTREGKSITILYKEFRPYFFVVEPSEGLRKSLKNNSKVLSAEDDRLFYQEETRDVVKLSFRNTTDFKTMKDSLNFDYRILSGDITLHYRFFYDMDMGSCIRVVGEEIPKTVKRSDKDPVEYVTDLVVEMSSFENIDSFDPDLKILSFDIENSITHGFIYTICAVIGEHGTIRECEPITGSEADIIRKFAKLIQDEDPDVLSGYNIDNYDITKIVERAAKNGISNELKWGRNLGSPMIVSKRFWRVKGRLIVDAWWAARRELRPKQETLNAVSEMLLGESKLDVDPKNMDAEWANNKDLVLKYCVKDAELSLRILLKVGTIRKGMDLATVSKLTVQDVLTSGTSTLVDSLLIRKADREKIGVPKMGKMSRVDQIEGGYVHTMNPGLYHWVCVLDFKSMYPSLIIAKNICFTTLSRNGSIVSSSGARYLSKDKKVGLLPGILEGLMNERDSIKAKMKKTADKNEYHYLDGLQAAVKVLMNTFYGVFASSFYRFTDKNIGASITAFARDTVKGIIGELESRGVKVIYSDTDSVFVQSPDHTLEGSLEFGRTIADEYSKEGGVLEFEKLIDPLFSHGKKKRYFGKIVWPETTDALLIRGYETRRTDSFDYQDEVLEKLFVYVLEERNEDAVTMVRNSIQDLLKGNVPVSELVISKSCKEFESYKNPESQTSVQTAMKMLDMGYEFIPGMKVSWIVTNSKSSPQETEPYISGKEFPGKPDYLYYAGRLASAAARITEVYGWGETDLLRGAQQSTLFDDGGSRFDRPAAKKAAPTPKPGARNTKLSDFF